MAIDAMKVLAEIRAERQRKKHDGAKTGASAEAPGVHNGSSSATSVDAGKLFTDLHDFLRRYICYPSTHAQVAHTLWCAHTHCMSEWHTTPRLAFMSEEKESGKTRALEVTELVTPGALLSFNASPAAMVRKVAAGSGCTTVLYDEIDALFGSAKREEGNLDVRSVLNSGYRRGAKCHRCVTAGKRIKVEELDAFAPVAVAGLRNLPDTLASRAIIIRMRPRTPDEKVEQFRRRWAQPIANEIYGRLAAWCGGLKLADVEPDMPDGVADRAAECWEPLLAIADAVGGIWPNLAREAAKHFVQGGRHEAQSLGVELLEHIREAFGGADALWTETLLERLIERPESPWKDIYGKPLTDRGLAQRLKNHRDQHGEPIRSCDVKLNGTNRKGYRAEQFHDVWPRYLEMSATRATRATFLNGQNKKVAEVAQVALDGGTPIADVACNCSASATPPSPDLWADLDIPASCRRCAHCGRGGAVNIVTLHDGKQRQLHRECEAPWLATHDNPLSRQPLNGGTFGGSAA
jgi:Protein of unknown function (DUF3631)